MSYDKHYGKPQLINAAVAEIVLPRIGCRHLAPNVDSIRFFLDSKGLVIEVKGWLTGTQYDPGEDFIECYQMQWVDPNVRFLTAFKDLLKTYDVGVEQCNAEFSAGKVPMVYVASNAQTAPNLDLWEQCFSIAPTFYFTRTRNKIDKPHAVCSPTAPWDTRLLVSALLAHPKATVIVQGNDGKECVLNAVQLTGTAETPVIKLGFEVPPTEL